MDFYKILLKPVLLLFGLLIINGSESKNYSVSTISFRNNTFDVFRADLNDVDIRFIWKDEENNNFRNFNKAIKYFKKKEKKIVFATNGGMYDVNNAPLGLYIENGKVLVKLNRRRGGRGNFYLKPNGVFLIGADGAHIIEANDFFKIKYKIKYATQSGPLLVYKNKIHPAFNEGSSNLYIRSGVGINNYGETVFAISNEPVNFYDFALFFRDKLNCSNALYLDGAVSKMYLPDLNRYQILGNFGCMIVVLE